METYKREFIEFMVESDVLKFGDFTLKSGRKSPFFMNAGAYVTGEQLKRLGEYYARAINDNFGLDFDVLFGPAYKGIPLSVVTAIAIHEWVDGFNLAHIIRKLVDEIINIIDTHEVPALAEIIEELLRGWDYILALAVFPVLFRGRHTNHPCRWIYIPEKMRMDSDKIIEIEWHIQRRAQELCSSV